MRSLFRSIVTACLIAGAVLCFTIGALASNLPRVVGRPDIEDARDLSLPVAKLLQLKNDDGSVQVRTHDLGEIDLQASIKAYLRRDIDPAAAQAYVESLVRVKAGDNSLAIATDSEESPDGIELRVDYTILVPPGTDISVEGSNGNVWISKGCGRVSVQGRNADIEIAEPEGPVLAQSTNGRIRVLDAPDGATIKTVNGNVYAHMTGGVLRAATTNGAIVARVLNPRVEECTLSSQNGGITLVMRDECSATVEAVTERGVVTSDFAVDSTSGVQKRRHLKGMIGAGHTKLSMDTLNGNIWITKDTL